MQLAHYCTAALLAAVATVPLVAQSPQAPAQTPAEGDVEFAIFLGSTRVGLEQVRLARNGSTWIISSTAQFAQPLNLTVNRAEVQYTTDWQPTELHIEATQAGK